MFFTIQKTKMNYLTIIALLSVFLHQRIFTTLSYIDTFFANDPLAMANYEWFNGDIEPLFGSTQNPTAEPINRNMDSLAISLFSYSHFFYRPCKSFICFCFHHSDFGLMFFSIDRVGSYSFFKNFGAFLNSSKALAIDYPRPIVASQIYQLSINNSVALEVVDFLNVWGRYSGYYVPVMYYLSGPAEYPAPQKVYGTSCSMAQHNPPASKNFKYSWKLPSGVGFDYILKLHFCELEYEIKCGEDFTISIINNTAEYNSGVMKLSVRNGASVYAEYEVTVEEDPLGGRYEMVIWLFSREPHSYDERKEITRVIPENKLPLKFASGGNTIATAVVVLIIVLSILFHRLRVMNEKNGDSTDSSSFFCRYFSLGEIQKATNNFDYELVVGSGGFGKVYKGLIDDGATTVAIKRLNSKSKQGECEFRMEIEMLSKLRHSHLVTLLGYCDESTEMILVYELMEKGTLADHLHKTRKSDKRNDWLFLSWKQRLKICIGAARGLDYLHTGTRHGVIHRDVKTTNILLDRDLVAKISDFGLCKIVMSDSQTHVSTAVKGTFGYLDPANFLTRRITKKSDVYAFGVVLLEVLCGRPAVVSQIEEEQCSLVLWAQSCIKEGALDEIIEPRIREQVSPSSLHIFVEIVMKCLCSGPNARPTMAGVIVRLEHALASQEEDENSVHQEEDARKSSKGKLGKVIKKGVASLARSVDIRWRRKD